MPKKINFEMSEMSAVEFGTLLQDGKIIKMRAGKAVIEHTRKTRGAPKITTYHINLSAQIAHVEMPDVEEAVAKKAPKKPRAKKAAAAPVAEKTEKPAAKRKKRTNKAAAPVAEKTETSAPKDEKSKKPAKRKKRAKKAAAAPVADKSTAAPPAKTKKPASKSAASANIPWGDDDDDLGDDDYKL